MKCIDASILILDRQEVDGSNVGQPVQKYLLSRNNDFLMAFSTQDGNQIDQLYSWIRSSEPIAPSTLSSKLSEIVRQNRPLRTSDLGDNGFLITKNGISIQFNELVLHRTDIACLESGIPYKIIGEVNAVAMATMLLVNWKVINDDWSVATQKCISIMRIVAEHNNSVGLLESHGFDVFIFKNNGSLLHSVFNNTSSAPSLKLSFGQSHSSQVFTTMFIDRR